MGLFDTIINELYCPFCGAKQQEYSFQTKDLGSRMCSYDLFKLKGVNIHIHTSCEKCENWIDLAIDSCHGVHTLKEGQKQIRDRKKELVAYFKKKKVKG